MSYQTKGEYPTARSGSAKPKKIGNTVFLDANPVNEQLKEAKKREMKYATIVIKKSAAGIVFSEDMAGDLDKIEFSIPCEIEKKVKDAAIVLSIDKVERVLKNIKQDTIKIEYTDSNSKLMINGDTLLMPNFNQNEISSYFTPEKI